MPFNTDLSAEAATLTKWLISIPSVTQTKSPVTVTDSVYEGLCEFPYFKNRSEHLIKVRHSTSQRSTVLALVKAETEVKDTLVLLCDPDTVSPAHYGTLKNISTLSDTLSEKLKNNLNRDSLLHSDTENAVFGLGALESKTATGCMLAALKELSDRHVHLNINILLICTSERHNRHNGIRESAEAVKELCAKENLKPVLTLCAEPVSKAEKIRAEQEPSFTVSVSDRAGVTENTAEKNNNALADLARNVQSVKNNDTAADNKNTGQYDSEDILLYTGNDGRADISFYILGQSTDPYSAFNGFSAGLIAAELIRLLELNADLMKKLSTAASLPALSSLRMREFCRGYTPDGIQLSFALPLHRDLKTDELIELMKDLAAKALENAAALTDRREAELAAIRGESFIPQSQDAEVLAYSDLLERASGVYSGDLKTAVAKLVAKCRKEGLSSGQSAVTVIERLNDYANLPRPSVVVYFSDRLILPQGLDPANADDRKLIMLLDRELHNMAENFKVKAKMIQSRSTGDCNYMRPVCSSAVTDRIRAECPLNTDSIPDLNVPAVTYGLTGGNLTRLGEFASAENFRRLPALILSLAEALGSKEEETVLNSFEDLALKTENLSRAAVTEAQTVHEQSRNSGFYSDVIKGTLVNDTKGFKEKYAEMKNASPADVKENITDTSQDKDTNVEPVPQIEESSVLSDEVKSAIEQAAQNNAAAQNDNRNENTDILSTIVPEINIREPKEEKKNTENKEIHTVISGPAANRLQQSERVTAAEDKHKTGKSPLKFIIGLFRGDKKEHVVKERKDPEFSSVSDSDSKKSAAIESAAANVQKSAENNTAEDSIKDKNIQDVPESKQPEVRTLISKDPYVAARQMHPEIPGSGELPANTDIARTGNTNILSSGSELSHIVSMMQKQKEEEDALLYQAGINDSKDESGTIPETEQDSEHKTIISVAADNTAYTEEKSTPTGDILPSSDKSLIFRSADIKGSDSPALFIPAASLKENNAAEDTESLLQTEQSLSAENTLTDQAYPAESYESGTSAGSAENTADEKFSAAYMSEKEYTEILGTQTDKTAGAGETEQLYVRENPKESDAAPENREDIKEDQLQKDHVEESTAAENEMSIQYSAEKQPVQRTRRRAATAEKVEPAVPTNRRRSNTAGGSNSSAAQTSAATSAVKRRRVTVSSAVEEAEQNTAVPARKETALQKQLRTTVRRGRAAKQGAPADYAYSSLAISMSASRMHNTKVRVPLNEEEARRKAKESLKERKAALHKAMYGGFEEEPAVVNPVLGQSGPAAARRRAAEEKRAETLRENIAHTAAEAGSGQRRSAGSTKGSFIAFEKGDVLNYDPDVLAKRLTESGSKTKKDNTATKSE